MKRFIFILLLLASCTAAPTEVVTEVVGKEGIIMKPIQVDDEVYVGEEIVMTYELYNRGASDLTPRNYGVIIPSFDKLYLKFEDYVASKQFLDASIQIKDENDETLYDNGILPFWMEGRDRFVDGDREYVTLVFSANPIARNSAQASTSILFSTCYPYQSNVTTDVCIEQTRITDQGSLICSNVPVQPNTPAAPIGVDRVEVRNNRDKSEVVDGRVDPGKIVPQFRIFMRNYGDGVPSSSNCLDGNKDLNSVYIRAWLLNTQLDCNTDETQTKSSIVDFINGQAQVLCSVPSDSMNLTAGTANYISLLSVSLEYTYRESHKSDIMIINE